MQVTIKTWRMREQCVPGSLSSTAQEPGNEDSNHCCSRDKISRTEGLKATPNQLLVSHPPRFPPASTFQPYLFVLTIWRMRRLPLR